MNRIRFSVLNFAHRPNFLGLKVVFILAVALCLLAIPELVSGSGYTFDDGSGFNPLNGQTATNPAYAAFDDNWWSWVWDNPNAGKDCSNGGNQLVAALGPYTSTVQSGQFYYAEDGCLSAALGPFGSSTPITVSGSFTVTPLINQATATGVTMGISSSSDTTVSVYDASNNFLASKVVPANLATAPNTATLSYVTLTAPNIYKVTVSGKPTVGCDNLGFGTTQCIVVDNLVVYANPFSLTATAGSGQSAKTNAAFATPLAVTVKDSDNNPVNNATVIFQAPNNGASGTFAGGSTTVTATTNISGTATAPTFTANGTAGSYNVTATLSNSSTSANFALTNTTSGYTYYLPFVGNGAGGYTSYLAFQNVGTATANYSLKFFDTSGGSVSTPTLTGTCATLSANAECVPNNAFASGQSGSGVIVSDQPLNVIVAESTPYGGSAYAVNQGASSSLVAPVIIRGGLGDFTTRLTIFNGGNTAASGTVQFYNQDGTLVSAATKNFSLNSETSISYDQNSDSSLGSNFYGWAQISGGSGAQLVAQVLEQSPSQHFVALANAQASSQTKLFAPAIFHAAYGAFNTGINIINPNAQAVTVNITYYNKDGTTYTAPAFPLAAHSLQAVFQGSTTGGTGLPAGTLPTNFAGAAVVSATGGVVMLVNEIGGTTAAGNSQSGTYSATANGTNSVRLPVIANGGFGYVTGATIFNSSSQTVNGTIQYYNLDGTTQGAAKSFNIGANQSLGIFQGDSSQNLPGGFYGTAIVTENGGGNDLMVTTNAISNAIFYSYTEPYN